MTAAAVETRPTLAPLPFTFSGVAAPISHGTASERLSSALRRHVGRERLYSIEQFRRRIGASDSYVEKFMTGERTPSLATLLTMKAALPTTFANDLIELAGLTGARRLNGTAQTAAVVLAELADKTADIARDLVDGRLDHVEKAELRKTLPPLIEKLQEFVAQLARE